MSNYYFDFIDGESFDEDRAGLECRDDKAARYAAVDGIVDALRDILPNGPERRLMIRVRDANGNYIFECKLNFIAKDLRNKHGD